MERDNGYSSVTVLIMILFLSSIIIGLMSFLRISQERNNKYKEHYRREETLKGHVMDLIDILIDDPTPEADSLFDPVWAYIKNQNTENQSLELEDVSSRFNLNFMRTKMLDESVFKGMMIRGSSPENLKLYRGEEGFFTDINLGYDQFFEKEILHEFFTVYGYANLNVTYEDSLKKLYEHNVSSGGSSSFLGSIQQLISTRTMADLLEMKRILGVHYDSLYPLVNIESLMNVNFVPEEILLAVLNYPYGGEKHKDSRAFYELISAERESFEFSSDRLDSLLQLEEDYLRIKEYLGTITWFWRITAKEGNRGLEVIIALLPNDNSGEREKNYKVIQWKFLNG